MKVGDRVRHLGIRGPLRGRVQLFAEADPGLVLVRWPDRSKATWHAIEDLRVVEGDS